MKRLFIHIPKCGGNTLQREPRLDDVMVKFGRDQFPPQYVMAQREAMAKHGLKPQLAHCRWRDLRPEFTAKHRAVAIVRNPWSRVVSMFLFAKKINRETGGTNPLTVPESTSFDEFLEQRHRWGNEPYFWHRTTVGWYPQLDYVANRRDEIQCDILRFEHHATDVCAYFRLETPVPRRNVTGEDYDYRRFYTDKTRKAVEDWYRVDILTFGFTFDGAATRNTIWET